MKIILLSHAESGQKVRTKKTIQGSLAKIALTMLRYVFWAHRKKAKIEHCSVHFVHSKSEKSKSDSRAVLKSIREKLSVYPEALRISVLIILNVAVMSWMVNQKILAIGFSRNYAEGEEIGENEILKRVNIDPMSLTKFDLEKNEQAKDGRNKEIKDIAERLNEIVASQDERCQSNKEKGLCNELCLKNEEEIIAKMKEEERQAWLRYLASKPKVVHTERVSCAEKNDGDPSKSKTKGKHMDEDCCPDPDEWPKPGCRYSAKGLALMLDGPKKHR